MQVNDYVIDFLVEQGIREVFVITGGAIAFILDAFKGRKDIKAIPCGHEQAAAMMADAYSRMGPGYACCMATSGPGATNLLTGLACSWFDSVPALFITGQVNTYEQSNKKGTEGVKQVGFQETDIVSIMTPVTKYAVMLDKPENIRYELEKATYIAKYGRQGPVLIDIPMNFQRAEIKGEMKEWIPPKPKKIDNRKKIIKAIKLLESAKRPVLVIGAGCQSVDPDLMKWLVYQTGFPIVTSWGAVDIFDWNNPQLVGCHGVYGTRAANFTVQNADVILAIGCRLDTRQTGGRPEMYAREAKLIMVDIDKAELNKRRGLTPYISIESDATDFINQLVMLDNNIPEWLTKTQEWKKKYPTVKKEYYDAKDYVDPYVFGKVLSDELDKDAIIVLDSGGNLTWMMQSFQIKEGQRMFSAYGNSPMGYAVPAAMGASIARQQDVICTTGDGGFQFNIQEMQTIVAQNLPIKIFIFNNQGYGIIRQFQNSYLNGNLMVTSAKDGVTNPDFMKIAKSYGVPGIRINNHGELKRKIRKALKTPGPVLIEIMMDKDQEIIPKLSFGNPLENQHPLLPKKELKDNMIVSMVEADKKLTEAN